MTGLMTDHDVQEKVRRIVARIALRKSSILVQDWQAEERANARLAKRLSLVFLFAAITAVLVFISH